MANAAKIQLIATTPRTVAKPKTLSQLTARLRSEAPVSNWARQADTPLPYHRFLRMLRKLTSCANWRFIPMPILWDVWNSGWISLSC